MMVLAIGTGGKLEVAEQFKNLNAGAIDISYESNAAAFGSREKGKKCPEAAYPAAPCQTAAEMRGAVPSMNGFFGDWGGSGRQNQSGKLVLSTADMEELAVFVPDVQM